MHCQSTLLGMTRVASSTTATKLPGVCFRRHHHQYRDAKTTHNTPGASSVVTPTRPPMSMSHCPTASLPAAPVAATYDTSKYLHNPASLAPLSAAFPRNSWSEGAVFGLPPYHSGEHAYQLCWAAREASKCWERVLSREHADSGDLSSSIQASDVVDATCFKLAVVDKALEV